MREKKINLQKYTSVKGSKWYLVKLLFYVICITILSILIYTKYSEEVLPQKKMIKDQKEIQGVTLEKTN